MANKDEIYKKPLEKINPFVFDKHTAEAFDDMAERSIPLYHDLQLFVARVAQKYYQPGSNIYDLGCSTGTTVAAIRSLMKENCRIIAVDKSEEMIGIARKKFQEQDAAEWQCCGIEEVDYSNASIVNAAYVLQFIDPDKREELIRSIYNGMNKGGILLLSEKTCSEDQDLNIIMTDHYYAFKGKNGYSDLEIRQKEKALQNILIQFTASHYEEILRRTGFSYTHIIFKYMNFMSMAAFK